MKSRQVLWAMSMLILCLASAGIQASGAAPSKSEQRPEGLQWVERPWEIGRFVYIHEIDSWKAIHVGRKANNQKDVRRADGFLADKAWEGEFNSTHEVRVPESDADSRIRAWAVVVVEFDRDGWVLTPNGAPGRLRGRLAESLDLQLSVGDGKDAAHYWLANWFEGFGRISERWAPAVCMGASEIYNRSEEPYGHYLYGKHFKPDSVNRVFGCREWAHQLHDTGRPYIDVTNYVRPSKDDAGGRFIHGDFIGWFRHGESKPVVGQHEGRWYCLLDCPEGEKPGPIADITTWTQKRGWRAPKAPTRMPVFPDPPMRSGVYPK